MPTIITDTELNNLLIDKLNEDYNAYPSEIICLFLMYVTGCRPDESTNTALWSVNNNGTVTLQPLKDNNPRSFSQLILPPDWLSYMNNKWNGNNITSYRKLQYTWFNRIHGMQIKIGDKSALLYLFRHNYVKQLKDADWTPEQIQIDLGHKNIESTMSYINSVITAYY